MCLSCIYRGRPCEPLLQLYVYITKDRVVQLCLRPILRRRNLKTEVSLWKRIKCFPSALHRRNLKTPQSPVILDFRLRPENSGNHMIIVAPSFTKSCVFKMFSVHTKTRSQRFQISPVWFSVFEKLRFRDGLAWTVGLTEEIKLRFQIPRRCEDGAKDQSF